MRSKFFSHYFIITVLAVSLAAGLAWLDYFLAYQATVNILIIEKIPGRDMGETLSEAVQTLRFYDQLLVTHPSLIDPFFGQSPDDRKAGWQRSLVVDYQPSSGLLTLSVWSRSKESAHNLATAATTTLFSTATQWYNVKTELDMRIADGPIVRPGIRSYPLYIGTSFVTGLVVSILFFTLLFLLDTWLIQRKKKKLFSIHSSRAKGEDLFRPSIPPLWQSNDWKTTISADRVTKKPLTPTFEGSLVVSQTQGTATAPPNLPVLGDDLSPHSPLQKALARLVHTDINETVRSQTSEGAMNIPAQSVPRTEEPTQEEYKRRLNELLSGKMK